MNFSKNKIDGETFEKIVVNGANNLKVNIKTVNDLNVFPIPDGDTGDNMFMTIAGGIEGLKSVKENSLYLKAKALADGMLLNARGNSGVILSQLFTGLAKGLKEETVASINEFSSALKEGVKQAYASVVKPVEGTMLTVARESAEFASKKCNDDSSIDEFFDIFVEEMQKSLERTPDLLAVLREAGVIDSGGAGLLYIAEGMKDAVEGHFVEEEMAISQSSNQTLDFSKFDENSEMTFGYCTECLLRLQNAKTDVKNFDVKIISDYLESIGDSIVAIKNDSIVKLHVHTLTPSKVLEFCQQFGEFLTIKIENMTLQHNETHDVQKTDGVLETLMPKVKREHKKFAMVTVATGKGLIDTFKECGADVVIDGGQGNNPSIEVFLKAFEQVDADNVFVLPNNSNIIMAAKQAASLYKDSKIYVIGTKNFGQAYSILSMLDYSADDADIIVENMKNDMQNVVTGMVTGCIRTANIDGVDVVKGNYIGFTDKTMLVCESSKVDTYKSLVKKLNVDEKSFAIAVYGASVSQEERQNVRTYMSENHPCVEFYEIDGEQDVYDFIVIME